MSRLSVFTECLCVWRHQLKWFRMSVLKDKALPRAVCREGLLTNSGFRARLNAVPITELVYQHLRVVSRGTKLKLWRSFR